jgi:excisionase family DNA binding protein
VPRTLEARTYATRQVAALLGVTEHTVGAMCRRGELTFIKVGRKRVFPITPFHRDVLHEEPPCAATEEAA